MVSVTLDNICLTIYAHIYLVNMLFGDTHLLGKMHTQIAKQLLLFLAKFLAKIVEKNIWSKSRKCNFNHIWALIFSANFAYKWYARRDLTNEKLIVKN